MKDHIAIPKARAAMVGAGGTVPFESGLPSFPVGCGPSTFNIKNPLVEQRCHSIADNRQPSTRAIAGEANRDHASARILIIRDEAGSPQAVDLLTLHNYQVATTADFGQVGEAVNFDLLILEVTLLSGPGVQLCSELRRKGIDTAILLLMPRADLNDMIAGLRSGADECLTKPFHPEEFLARIEVLVRRIAKKNRIPVESVRFGDVEVDFETCEVKKDGRPVGLSQKEMRLLRYLVDHRGRVVTRDEVLRTVWDYVPNITSRTIDVHIAWLRRKLESDPGHPSHICTVRGEGYCFTS